VQGKAQPIAETRELEMYCDCAGFVMLTCSLYGEAESGRTESDTLREMCKNGIRLIRKRHIIISHNPNPDFDTWDFDTS
jgi:hypothetical protein